FSTPQTITLTTGELSISEAATIIGPGASLTTVSGNKASRVFNIIAAPAGASIAISGLTMTDGIPGGDGGAIVVSGEALTLTDCTLSNNVSAANGGAVAVSGGSTVIVRGCAFSNNKAKF